MQTLCGTLFAMGHNYQNLTLAPNFGTVLLCVCAREIVSRGTQHQELRKVKTK